LEKAEHIEDVGEWIEDGELCASPESVAKISEDLGLISDEFEDEYESCR
jgi:hypothetical protein